MTNAQVLVGGEWTAARFGETEEIRSPYDRSAATEISTAGPAELELAPAVA